MDGRDGRDGKAGPPGPPGLPGYTGKYLDTELLSSEYFIDKS